jgi:intracellular sulfur oxidation DsrE/DsrF family protein
MHYLLKSAAIGMAGLAAGFMLPNFTRSQTTSPPSPAHSTAKRVHRVIIQITQNDPAVMNMALNNAENLTSFYKERDEPILIEFVAYGAGLNMVRSDTSLVKERLAIMAGSMKNVTFAGCGNTLTNQSKLENKNITLIPGVRIVPTGVARVVELEEQGWAYVRP